MRSIIIFAALIAAIGFTGCRGTGGSCPLGHGCKLGKIGKRAAQAQSVESCCDQGGYVETGDCGCGGDVYSDQGAMDYAPADGGCGCGGAPTVSPMQFSAPAGGGCSACEGASTETPGKLRGLLVRRDKGDGMGLGRNDQGLACSSGGPERRAQRQAGRSLRPKRAASALKGRFGFGATDDMIEEYDLVSDEFVAQCDGCSSGVAGRRISHGVISDFREARDGRGHFGGGGCGRGGCGHSGRLCGACTKIRGLAGLGSGSPYGGSIPHTAQAPGQSGIAPSYAYPYYTTRGPRDFLRDNPPSIGR